jgi:hypothetical protein
MRIENSRKRYYCIRQHIVFFKGYVSLQHLAYNLLIKKRKQNAKPLNDFFLLLFLQKLTARNLRSVKW